MGYPDWQTEGTLADLIAGALATAGIPVLANPVPLYDQTAAAGAGLPGLIGATVDPSMWSATETMPAAIAAFDVSVNGNPAATAEKTFQNEGRWPNQIPARDAAVIASGATLYRCFKPSRTLSASEQNNLAAALVMYKAATHKLKAILFQEPQGDFATAQDWQDYWAFYSPVIRAAGVPLVYNASSAQGEAQVGALWPQLPPDIILQDYYSSAWKSGVTLGTMARLATAAGIPCGLGEWNYQAGSASPFDLTRWNTYVNYLIGFFTDWMTGGGNIDAIMFFMGTHVAGNTANQLLSASDPKVPGYNQLAAALSVSPGSPGVVIPAGTQVVVPPVSPSPVAGFAQANGLGYDLSLLLVAGAGSTLPFATADWQFINHDLKHQAAVHNQRWSLPAAVAGSPGALVSGRGPQRAKYAKLSLTNKDTVPMSATVQVNSTSRTERLDDWRWDAHASPAIPGFTTPGGQSYGLSLGADTIVLPGGATPPASAARLLSLYAGQVFLRLRVENASGIETVSVQLGPQPGGLWGSVDLFSQLLPSGSGTLAGEAMWTIALPRAPCLITFTSSDAADVTCVFEVVAIER